MIDPALLPGFDDVYRDGNGDGFVTPDDALVIINFLNGRMSAPEGEATVEEQRFRNQQKHNDSFSPLNEVFATWK